MKRKIGQSYVLIRWGIGMFMLFFAFPSLFSQEDSIRVLHGRMVDVPINVPTISPVELLPVKQNQKGISPLDPPLTQPDFSLKRKPYIPYYTNPSPLFLGDYRTSGVLKQFTVGTLYGTGGQTTLPGIGRFNDASLGYRHRFSDKLMMQIELNAMKINMSRITGQAFSASGTLLYRPSDKIGLKVFGSYAIGNTYGMNTHQYGGTISFDMSDRFSMEVGMRRYYNSMRGTWETVPIAIPTYRFNQFKLGFDVGGVVYEILRSTVFDK